MSRCVCVGMYVYVCVCRHVCVCEEKGNMTLKRHNLEKYRKIENLGMLVLVVTLLDVVSFRFRRKKGF